jgi:hypothetical protein
LIVEKKKNGEIMLKQTIALLILLQISILSGMQIELQFDEPIIKNSDFSNRLPVNLNPEEPKIAYFPVKILLPMGQEVESVNIIWENPSEQTNIYLDYAKQQVPISIGVASDNKRDEEIYGKNEFFPAKEMDLLGTQRYRGYEILLVNLYPYSYNPVEEKLKSYDNASLQIFLKESSKLRKEQNQMLVSSQNTTRFLEKIVINPHLINSYSKHEQSFNRNLPDSNNPYQMVIITDEVRAPFFTDFIEWKVSKGIETGLFLTSDIYANYSGENNASKIRNFIVDAFAVYGATEIPLEYILLGGDDEIIPVRGAYGEVGSYVDTNIPCDLYYSCLDGEWDGNGNGIYGEYDDLPTIDLIPEVAIGRISAETETEFTRLFNKTYHYADTVTASQDIAYMLGENLNWNPLTWGAWYKEEVRPLIVDNSDFKVFSLYEMEGTYSSETVRNAINGGLAMINHMGHSNETMVFGQSIGAANSYTNTEYGFAYSQGCYPAALDEATSGAGECIAEHLTNAQNGLYAFVGNTRYGWYSPGDTNGASQYYDLTFFQALFEENIRSLGEALQFSKVALLNEAMVNDVMRWVYYEMVVLGDPSVEVKDPTNSFPYLEPVTLQFDDVSGDGDGVMNPNEEVHIYPTIQNLPDWANAFDVYCKAEFPEDFIVLADSIFVGDVSANSQVVSEQYFHVIIPENCNYNNFQFQLTIYSDVSGQGLFQKSYSMTLPVSLFQADWPIYSQKSIRSNVMTTQSGTGFDILTADVFGNLHRYDYQGNALEGTNGYEESIKMSAAMADINQDGEDDLVFAGRNGVIYATDLNGEEIFYYQTNGDFLYTPVIADINGDGAWESIATSTNRNLYAIHSDGQPAAGFPYELDQISYGEIASADITGDGNYEIIAGTLAGTLYVIDGNGNDCPGFPIALGEMLRTAPTILNNGNIVIGGMNHLFIVSSQGEILLSEEIDGTIANSVIAADFTNNGEQEIAFQTMLGTMSIMRQDGSVLDGWPISHSEQFVYPPLAADLDNDGSLELISVSNVNKVFAYHVWGESISGMPVPINLGNDTPASIADIDGDGDYELMGSSENTIYAIDFKTRKGSKLPWRTYRGNFRRTGNSADNLLTDYSDSVVEIPSLKLFANYPNPFNPTTNIRFALPEEGNVSLTIYNIKGQKIKTLAHKEMAKGEHVIQWNGTDNANQSVASGVYFYRLKTDEKALFRKCLLLK